MDAVSQAPAIGYSIVANLGGDRQMTVQCFVGEQESDEAVNSKIDRVFRVVDRQKARYELVDIREELIKHQDTLAQFIEDHDKVEADYHRATASRGVELLELADRRKDVHDTAYKAHSLSGRRGAFAPQGHVAQALAAYDAAKVQVEEQQKKADAERDQFKQNLEISKKRYEDQIVVLKEKIAAREALLQPADGG